MNKAMVMTIAGLMIAAGSVQGAWPSPYLNSFQVGLTDAEHTLVDGSHFSSFAQMNAAGRVTGASQRYNSDVNDPATNPSVSAWTWAYGSGTIRLGFTDTEHTSSTDVRASYANNLSANGTIAGYSLRYDGAGFNGATAWGWSAADGLVPIGFRDAAHTSASNYRFSFPTHITSQGQIIGYSDVFDSTGTNAGQTAWSWTNAGGTIALGLTDTEHTRSDGIRSSNLINDGVNDAGRVIGYSARYAGGAAPLGTSAWTWSSATGTTRLGFVDAAHTAPDGTKESLSLMLSEGGRVAGYSSRYVGSGTGSSAWAWSSADGQTRIGLIDSAHTSSSGVQYSRPSGFIGGDRLVGSSTRYTGDTENGVSAWVWNPSSNVTTSVGLFDGAHTQTSTGYQESTAFASTSSTWAVGLSNRYDASSNYNGTSAWAWNPTTNTTTRIGLIDSGHTNASSNEQYNVPITVNAAGRVVGKANHYSGSTLAGQSAWTWDPSTGTTTRLGLFSAGQPYTSQNGTQVSEVFAMNAAGDIVGVSTRYQASSNTARGHGAWFFDHSSGTITQLVFSFGATNRAEIRPMVLTDGGVLMGTYDKYATNGVGLSPASVNAFLWSSLNGLTDLGALVNGGLSGQSIAILRELMGNSTLDQIVTNGRSLTEASNGQNVFVLAVPAPGVGGALAFAGILASRCRRR
jgi:hypothetical protein